MNPFEVVSRSRRLRSAADDRVTAAAAAACSSTRYA
jgi:hypothetical protein